MRKVLYGFIIVLLFFSITINVNADDEHYKNINVSFNYNDCVEDAGGEITIQLFADNEKVEGEEVILNSTTGYDYTFEDLLVFKTDSSTEIKYDVRLLEDGKYRRLSEKNATHEKATIKKWVQVLPEDIKAGHTYVIITNNLNWQSNGFSKIIYLRGDVTAKGANVVPEYNIIDGKPSYYALVGEPIDNTKWTVSNVPTDDPDYEEFKDYLMFTNESEGKKLTLTGYINGDNVNFIYKRSGKNGFIEADNAMNTNKVSITSIDGSLGKFYIGTRNLLPEPNNMMQYITLSNQNQYQAGSNMQDAAQFMIFEYVEKEVELGTTVNIEDSLCKKDTVVVDTDSEFKRDISVNLNCEKCKKESENGVTIQLFADGVKVEDGSIQLNNDTGLSYVFKNLPVFNEEKTKAINYEIKVLKDGKYFSIPEKDYVYEKEMVSGWTQVFPKDIKAGNTYVLITENLNYKNNGFSRYIYLRGDISAKGANVKREFNIINDKKTYYSLEGDPIENTKWTVSKVPTDDPDYEEFKNYLMFTNETENKKLTLTGYINGNNVHFIYKRSGKNGFIESDNAMNTNKVDLISADELMGTFYIGTRNLLPEPNNMMQYISLNGSNQYGATPDIDSATKFMAFEYGTKEIAVASSLKIDSSLCDVLSGDINNPNTGYNPTEIILLGLILAGTISFIVRNKRKLNNN